MIRSAVLTLLSGVLIAGCAVAPQSQSPAQPGSPAAQRVPDDEVHRGLLQNQKSSPDAPSGDGRGQ